MAKQSMLPLLAVGAGALLLMSGKKKDGNGGAGQPGDRFPDAFFPGAREVGVDRQGETGGYKYQIYTQADGRYFEVYLHDMDIPEGFSRIHRQGPYTESVNGVESYAKGWIYENTSAGAEG